MASQQVLFAETIAGMKKAFKRKAYGELPLRPASRSIALLTTIGTRPQSPTPIPRSKATATEDTSSRGELASPTEGSSSLRRDLAHTRR